MNNWQRKQMLNYGGKKKARNTEIAMGRLPGSKTGNRESRFENSSKL